MKVRNKQCAKCPWKVSVNPDDIPNGYSPERHRGLRETIAGDDSAQRAILGGEMRLMACHESTVGDEYPCVGWVANQLGPGNNIGLRLMALDGRFNGIETVGEQHETFQKTLRHHGGE